MRLLSATDVALALAIKNDDLRIVERMSRFGDTFIALEDARGVIEVHNTRAEADARIASIKEAIK